jgi:hypothetical protein
MGNTKIIKKIAIGLICLALPVLIILNIFQRQQMKKYAQGINPEIVQNNKSATNPSSGKEYPFQQNSTQEAAPGSIGTGPASGKSALLPSNSSQGAAIEFKETGQRSIKNK